MICRSLYFEVKYLVKEISLCVKHPTRKATYDEIWYHWRKIWDNLIFHPWYCFTKGIKNLIIWFPLIWKNREWDYWYLTELMDKQFSEMEKFWYSDKPHVTKQKQIAKRITWIRKLYKMWIEEYYTMKHYDEHEAKYGKSKFESEVCKVDEFGVPVLYKLIDTKTEEEKTEYLKTSKIAWEKDKKVFSLWIKNLSKIRMMWD